MSRGEPHVEGSEAEWMPVRISREVAATLFVFGQVDAPTITTSEDDWFEARQQGRDRPSAEELSAALCKAAVGHYRDWEYPEMGEAAHMGLANGDHLLDAEAVLAALSEQGTR